MITVQCCTERIKFVNGPTFEFNVEAELEIAFWKVNVFHLFSFALRMQLAHPISSAEFCDAMLAAPLTSQRNSVHRSYRSARPYACKPHLNVTIATMQTSRQRREESTFSSLQINRQREALLLSVLNGTSFFSFRENYHYLYSIEMTLSLVPVFLAGDTVTRDSGSLWDHTYHSVILQGTGVSCLNSSRFP